MIRLDNINRSLQLFLGGAKATNDLQIIVSYSDQTSTSYLGATQLSNSNGTFVVTICSAPPASTIRDIDMVSVLNTDTTFQTVTIQCLDTATTYKIINVQLNTGDKLTWTHGSAWQVVDNSGNLKYTVLTTGGVNSFNSRTGAVALTSSDVTTALTYTPAPQTSGGSILYGNGAGGFSNVAIGSGVSFAGGTLSATGSGGSVTSVSVVSANGFAGTVATSTTTPAITISTTISGLIKGNATAISAATVGTDYSDGTSALATGILKSTTTTGALSIAVAADFPTLNQNTTGSAATLTTARAIYGNNFDGSAALTQIIASTYGGTGNGFTKFSGATTTERTYTLPDANATILYSGGPLGTPSSGTVTNLTGTASININGTVGATTANTGQFTTGAFGGTQSTAQQLLIGGNSQTASTTEYGINNNQTVQSAVTSLYGGVIVNPTTQATSFTLNNLYYFFATAGSFGAGSAVTNQAGFQVGANLTAATNNYAFFGNIPSATGRWNFYASGTAANYMAGQLSVGTTSLTNGYFNLAGTQSIAPAMSYIGGANTNASSTIYSLQFASTLTGTTANTLAYGMYGSTTFNQASGTTVTSNIGIISQPTSAMASGSTLTNFQGFNSFPILNTTVTPTNMLAYIGQLSMSTSATGGTIAAGTTYYSATPNFNASSTTGFTNYYGYYASNVAGTANNAITNAYAFYANQASSNTGVSSNWNFYANGTAPNFFNGDMRFNKTVTATGTTGAQTISKNAGTVNFAATNTSLVVTNTLVTTSSIIIATVGTNDTTMKSVSAVAAAGSFTLFANAAATAETRVNFIVIN